MYHFSMYLPRGLEPAVARNLSNRPVVMLEGARGVGKTRLAQHLLETGVLAGEFFTFADETTHELARSSPKAFVDDLPFGSVVDEAQLVPEIQLQLKQLVDADSSPGRVLLTGSARLAKDQLAGTPPLAGRSTTLRLEPFTRSERHGLPRSAHAALFDGDPHRLDFVAETQSVILAEALGGGFPMLTNASDRRNFIDDALPDAVVGRRNRSAVLEMGRQLAARTAKPYVADQLARDLGYDKRTVEQYVDIWEDVMLVRRLTNWRPSPGDRTRAQKRIHVVDIGLATAWGQLDLDRDRGPLFETLVANELIAQAWAEDGLRVYHYRDKSTYEVDLLLQRDGSDDLIGIEVKAASEARPSDFRQLRDFRERSKGRMKYGYVLYTGDRTLPIADGLWALPIPALWGPPSTEADPEESALASAVADLTKNLRQRGNPSLLAARLPVVAERVEEGVDQFVALVGPALADLGIEVAHRSGRNGLRMSKDGAPFAETRHVLFAGRSSQEAQIVVRGAPVASDMVRYEVVLARRASPKVLWSVLESVENTVREAEFDVSAIAQTLADLVPALTDALADF